MHHRAESSLTRRRFFDRAGDGLYGIALAYLLGNAAQGRASESSHDAPQGARIHDLSTKSPHFAPRAKSVIHLCMQGGPSQVDTFDPKPALARYDGQIPPSELTESAVFANDRLGRLMASPFKFARHGRCGAWVSQLLPHTAQEVDSLLKRGERWVGFIEAPAE